MRDAVNKVDGYERKHENMTKDISTIKTRMNEQDELIENIREEIVRTTNLATDSKGKLVDMFSSYSAQSHRAMYDKLNKA